MIRIYLLHNNTLYRGGRYHHIDIMEFRDLCFVAHVISICITGLHILICFSQTVAYLITSLSLACTFYFVYITRLHISFCLYHKVAHFILFYTGLHILFCFLTGLHILFCFLTGLHILFYLITSLHILFCYITGLHIFLLLISLACTFQ